MSEQLGAWRKAPILGSKGLKNSTRRILQEIIKIHSIKVILQKTAQKDASQNV